MATDGDIDFATYTRAQLDGAVARIDRGRYPINAQNLLTEYQRRRVAESQAVEQAAKSETVLPPDHMLSVPKSFDVMFEPQASFINWLGPSRNDFHLIGSGTVRVDDALVRVKGRRYAYWIGIPVVDTDELGRQFVVNVEVQGRAVRFELRVPGEKVRGITLWLRNAAEAEELSRMLPPERTPDFTPQLAAHVQFERSLIAQSPKTPSTYALIGLCVFVFVGTALGMDHLFGFDGPSLVRLGSNFGPYTTEGEWWRLVTCLFLHIGLIHLAFNMWALASFGPLVERLYGSVSFALIYLIAGVAGSLASVSWNPAVNSVGASGAIFGLLGALIAAQVRNQGSIPVNVLRPLRYSSLIFTGFALLAGLRSGGVDNAAHLGGVAAGFLMGLTLSRAITGLPLSVGGLLRRLGVAVAAAFLLLGAGLASILILGVGVSTALSASKRLTGEGLYAATVHWFTPRERTALRRWRELGVNEENGKLDGQAFANAIEREVIAFWKEADARLAKVDLPKTSLDYDNLQFLLFVTHHRLQAYELAVQGLRTNDNAVADQAIEELQQVEDRIDKRSALAK